MRASGTPPVYIAGRGQDGGLQLHRGVVQPHPAPFWHPLSIPNRLRDADAQGNPNDLSDKPSTEPGQLQVSFSSGHIHQKLECSVSLTCRFQLAFAPPPTPIRVPIQCREAQRPNGLIRPHYVCSQPSYLCPLVGVRHVPILATWSAELTSAPGVTSGLQDVLLLNASVPGPQPPSRQSRLLQ